MHYSRNYTRSYHGEDKSGRPIYFDLSGRGDVAAAMAEGVTKEQLIRLHGARVKSVLLLARHIYF